MGGSGTSAHMTQSPLGDLDPELYSNLFLCRSDVGCGRGRGVRIIIQVFEPRTEMTARQS